MERKKHLFSGKGQKGCAGCGTAPGSLPPWPRRAGEQEQRQTPASPDSREVTSRWKVLQRIWPLTLLPASPQKQSSLLQEGEQVGGPGFEVLQTSSAFMRKGKWLSVGQAAPTGSLCCRMPARINIPGARSRSVR